MYQAIQDFGNYKVGDTVPEKDVNDEQSAYVVRVAGEPEPSVKLEPIKYPAKLTNSNPA